MFRETTTKPYGEDSTESGEFSITTEPAFDLLPEGYDQNFLKQIGNQDSDQNHDEELIENE